MFALKKGFCVTRSPLDTAAGCFSAAQHIDPVKLYSPLQIGQALGFAMQQHVVALPTSPRYVQVSKHHFKSVDAMERGRLSEAANCWRKVTMVTALKGAGSPVLIKKYGNRRLYDTTQSRYITLDDLAKIIRSGAAIKVVEASTERDLTRQVLTQVILEQQEALDMFPIDLLQAIIRVQGTLEQAPFSAFLSVATRQFIQHGSLWTQQMSAFFGTFNNQPGAPEDGRARPSTETINPSPNLDSTSSGGVKHADESRQESTQEPTDLDDLRQRMNNLLGKLGRS